MLNRFETISLSDVVQRTKMALRLQHTTEHDDYLEVLILEGQRQLNTNYNLKKYACTLDIVDYKAMLPNNVNQVIGLRFADENGNCQLSWYADKKFVEECDCSNLANVHSRIGTYMINGKYILFNSNLTATTCEVAYFGLNVDADGDLIFYEDYERALTAYACWKFQMSFHGEYPFNLTFEHKKEWIAQKAYLKGSAQVEDFQRNKREIKNIFNCKAISDLYNI